jgi:transcriptional regulator with XRE-family HTH domain
MTGMQTKPKTLLRGLREARRLSQQQLSDASGVQLDRIVRIEKGQHPKLDDARNLAEALGVTVDFLFPPREVAS